MFDSNFSAMAPRLVFHALFLKIFWAEKKNRFDLLTLFFVAINWTAQIFSHEIQL